MMKHSQLMRRLWVAIILAFLLNTGCHHLRFEETPPSPSESPKAAPEKGSEASWSSLAAQGRAAFRAQDLAESERAYLASLAATSHFEATDVRVATALDNLGRLAAYYQKIDEPEKAAPLVEVLTQNAEEGRKGDFESSSVPMVFEGDRLAKEKNYEAAARLYKSSLTLIGVDKKVNRNARLAAQWNLMQVYIDSSQISEAQQQMQSLSEQIKSDFGPDSRQAVALLVPMGQIQVANGDIAAAEESYLGVIDSDLSTSSQKIEALDLYIDMLQGLGRDQEAKDRSEQVAELRKQTDSTGS
ncbi:hypothetical protein MK280_05410 [Myxococcota bacterium]|nr:hypothetical protein [Myxococcota bacterium]